MRAAALLRSLWRNLAHRGRVEQELDDELRAYVALLAAEHERAGMTPDAARRAALVDTGGVTQVKEATRDARVGNALATGARELRYALRSLRRSPVFVVVAVVTLALGIGGATAVFTVVQRSLLRPLPAVAEPDRLVSVEGVQGTRGDLDVSYADYRDLRDRSTTLAGLAAYNGTSMAVEDTTGATTRAWVSYVSDDFFTVLGVRPAVGRLFHAAPDGAPGERDPVVVLGHDFWQRRYGGARSVIGATLRLDGHAFTVVGVAPRGFVGAMTLHPMELWIPLASDGRASPPLAAYGVDLEDRAMGLFRLIGRLAPGRRVEDARRELDATARWLAATHPTTNRGRTVRVLAGAGMTAEERAAVSRVPRLLAAAVALLLLIACGNVASLSLVRAAARRRELATRVALGASRAALVRQVVAEGVVVAMAAGALGIAIARALVSSATLVQTVAPLPPHSGQGTGLGIDAAVLAAALAATTLTAVLVSLLPAVQAFRTAPGAMLREGGGAVRRRSAGGQRALVVAQVGASLVLLSASAITFGAFQRVLDAHDAVDPRTLTDASLEVVASLPDTARRVAFYRAVLARATAEPAIAGAALTTTIPPFQWSGGATVFRRGEEPPPGTPAERMRELGLRVEAVELSPGFFDVMRIPLLRGRDFTARDDERSAPVAIVNRRLAAALWPGQDPIGQYLAWPAAAGAPRPPLRVVGVVADTRDLSLTSVPLAMYVPFLQHPGSNLGLVVRARGNAPVSASTLRRLVADVDPGVAVLGGRTLLDRLRAELAPQRTASAWVGVFGVIALLLAAIGLYGVVAQGVVQRTRELAVRAALGATPRGLLRLVLGDGLRLAAVGAVVGGLGALAAFRVLRSLFTGVAAADLRAAGVAATVLGLAMLAATYLPARRAARLDPARVLRSD
ncbi:MAG TPA: ADOP family duplicated permease [Gemmatimonadaceae bacterium]|nr:ADOP family duplicated permease [Gemmatimonadaceae bacterium]